MSSCAFSPQVGSAKEEGMFVVSEIQHLVNEGKVPGGYQEVALDPAPKVLSLGHVET